MTAIKVKLTPEAKRRNRYDYLRDRYVKLHDAFELVRDEMEFVRAELNTLEAEMLERREIEEGDIA